MIGRWHRSWLRQWRIRMRGWRWCTWWAHRWYRHWVTNWIARIWRRTAMWSVTRSLRWSRRNWGSSRKIKKNIFSYTFTFISSIGNKNDLKLQNKNVISCFKWAIGAIPLYVLQQTNKIKTNLFSVQLNVENMVKPFAANIV